MNKKTLLSFYMLLSLCCGCNSTQASIQNDSKNSDYNICDFHESLYNDHKNYFNVSGSLLQRLGYVKPYLTDDGEIILATSMANYCINDKFGYYREHHDHYVDIIDYTIYSGRCKDGYLDDYYISEYCNYKDSFVYDYANQSQEFNYIIDYLTYEELDKIQKGQITNDDLIAIKNRLNNQYCNNKELVLRINY